MCCCQWIFSGFCLFVTLNLTNNDNFMKQVSIVFLFLITLLFTGAGCVSAEADFSSEALSGVVDQVGQVAGELKEMYDNIEENVTDGESEETKNEFEGYLLRDGDSTLVRGKGFSLEIPLDWIVISADTSTRWTDDQLFYGAFRNGEVSDAYGDPNVINVNITDLSKELWSIDEAIEEFGWNDSSKDICLSMVNWFTNPEDAATEEDLLLESAELIIDDSVVHYSSMRSEKPCYIEGPARTQATYLIEGEHVIYSFFASNPTNEQTSSFLEEVEDIVKTFTFE